MALRATTGDTGRVCTVFTLVKVASVGPCQPPRTHRVAHSAEGQGAVYRQRAMSVWA